MLKIKVIAVGKCKELWLQEALAEYEKRLGHIDIAWHHPLDNAPLAALLELESHWIALDPQGELLDSPALSRKLFKLFEQRGSRLTFAIGGPEGLPPKLLQRAAWRWSLSPLTFTHQIARLLFVEQIYRAFEIERGSPYHK